MAIKTKWTSTYRAPSATAGLGQYQQRLDEAMKMLDESAGLQRTSLTQRYEDERRNRFGGAYQGAVSSGLAGGAIAQMGLRNASQKNYERQLAEMEASFSGQRQQEYSRLSGDLAAAQQSNFWQGQQGMYEQRRLGLEQQRVNMMGRYGGYASRGRRLPTGGMYGLGNQAVFAPRRQFGSPGSAMDLSQIRAHRRMYG